MRQVQFREYMLITGNLHERKKAQQSYNEKTGKTEWFDNSGELLACRCKGLNGNYVNYVNEEVYNKWVLSR